MRGVNAAGINIIKKNEGLRLSAYQDTTGVWTIGYGDTGPDVVPGLHITKADAEKRFADRLNQEFVPGVLRAIGNAPTTDNQLAAMVSLAYNIGVGGFSKSTVAKMHKKGDTASAARAFSMWNKAGGQVLEPLTRRRAEEADLYLTPDSDVVEPETPDEPTVPPAPEQDFARGVVAVKGIQTILALYGTYTDEIDGDWGEQTEEALCTLLGSLGVEYE